MISRQEPKVAAYFAGTEAEFILNRGVIDAGDTLRPLTDWNFLFDSTGSGLRWTFLGYEEHDYITSTWTMGEGLTAREHILEAEIMTDPPHTVKNTWPPDTGQLTIVGFGVTGVLDGVEIACVTPDLPDFDVDEFIALCTSPASAENHAVIVYAIAGAAAATGVVLLVYNRAQKGTRQAEDRSRNKMPSGQQPI